MSAPMFGTVSARRPPSRLVRRPQWRPGTGVPCVAHPPHRGPTTTLRPLAGKRSGPYV